MSEGMKTEVQDGCSVCGGRDDVRALEEHDAALQPATPLRTQFLSLSQNKRLPCGPVCAGCVSRATAAFGFQAALTAARPPPLSSRIEALRHKLLQLSRRIDVFLVVGDAGHAGQVGQEHEVIMVDRAALEAAADARALQPATDTRGDHVYQCTMCPQSFLKVSEFSAHSRTHPADAPHSCWSCGAQFTSREACVRHGASQCPRGGPGAPGGADACAACGASGTARGSDVCAACAAPLPTTRHQRHYVCGYDGCILRFATRNNLLAHIRQTHGAAPDPGVACALCQRTFASAAALQRHARTHAQEAERGEVEVEYLEVDELEEEAVPV